MLELAFRIVPGLDGLNGLNGSGCIIDSVRIGY